MKRKVEKLLDSFLSKALKLLIGIGMGAIIIFSMIFKDKTIGTTMVPNFVLMLAALVLAVVLVSTKLFNPESSKAKGLNGFLIFIVLFLVQEFICLNISFRTTWDSKAVLYCARYAAIGDSEGMANMTEYLSIYPSNLLLVWLYSLVFYWNECVFHITEDTLNLIQMIQCVLSAASGVLTYRCARKLFKSEHHARMALIFYTLITGITAWLVIPYSDSTGLILPVFLLYIILCYLETEMVNFKLLLTVVIGFLTYFSFRIKPEIVIVVIAFVIIQLFHFPGIKASVKPVLGFISGFVISMVLIGAAIDSLGYQLDAEKEFGWQFYIMQGVNVNTDGGNSDTDVAFSQDIDTKAQRDEENLSVAKQRIDEMGAKGLIRLICIKMYRPFSSGTFGWGGSRSFYDEVYEPRLGPVSMGLRNVFYEKEVYENGHSLYWLYALVKQFLWDFVIALSLLAAFSRKLLTRAEQVLFLTVVGIFPFFAIFESHPRYMMVQSPIIILLAVYGCMNAKGLIKSRAAAKTGR